MKMYVFNSKHAYWHSHVLSIPWQLRIFINPCESTKLWNENELWNLIAFDFLLFSWKGVKHGMIVMLTVSVKRVKALIIFTLVESRLLGSSISRNSWQLEPKNVPLLLINLITPTDFHFPWRLEKSGIHCLCSTTKSCCSTYYCYAESFPCKPRTHSKICIQLRLCYFLYSKWLTIS